MSVTMLTGKPPDMPRIGPNTIIQVAAVLRDRLSPCFAEVVLRDATRYTLSSMPTRMVDEREAQGVVRSLVTRMGATAATSVLREAGSRTAEYLLAARIPKLAQLVIRLAPRRLALALLLKAMTANAWTFAGSGHFHVESVGRTPELVFDNCPMCRGMHAELPMCDFYAGTFERLIGVLVACDVRIEEIACMAQGAPSCRFTIHGV